MNIYCQILHSCAALTLGWILLSGSVAARTGPPSNATDEATASTSMQMSIVLPLGWWQAEERTESIAEARLRKRLLMVAIVTLGVVSILGLFFAYLKMEYITRGFYSGRLQMLAIALAIVTMTICYLIWLTIGR